MEQQESSQSDYFVVSPTVSDAEVNLTYGAWENSDDDKAVFNKTIAANKDSQMRLNINSQSVSDNVDAVDVQAKITDGSMGLEFRHSQYNDSVEHEKLTFDQYQLTYRFLQRGNGISAEFGVDYSIMIGNDRTSGMVVSLPITFKIQPDVNLELRPLIFDVEGTAIRDLDASVMFSMGKVGIKAGYRTISRSNCNIDGPYLGFHIQF